MAHLKDLNLQMKVQAERIRLQSREGRTPGGGPLILKSQTPSVGRSNEVSSHGYHTDGRRMPKTTMTRQKSDRLTTGGNDPSNRLSSRGRDASATSSKIPIRKTLPGMSALKGNQLLGPHHPIASKRQKHVKFVEVSERPSDYTWHEAGRIQEIRIRYIARKFFHLWVSACFGKVGPHKIRAHYHKCLVRKVWAEWHDMWWVNRREWRLQVRAQYHYRYCTTRKVWQAWLQYVLMQRITNAKNSAANLHANAKCLQSTFTAWKQYMACRSIKKKNYGNAYRIADTRRLAQAWYQWTSQIQGVRDKQAMQQDALQHWADVLVHKTWMTWLARLAEHIEMKRKEQLSIEMFHRRLLGRCFHQGLMPYVRHRRDRKQEKIVASQFYASRMVYSHFQHWHTSWFTRRSLALRGQQIDALAWRARLRRAWIHWRYYINLHHIKAEKMSQAIQHHQRQLLKQGLYAFHTAVAMRKMMDIRKHKADELRYSLVLRRCWSTWLQGCEHKEELRLFVQSRKARNHYNNVLLSQVMHGWLRYTRWRQHRVAQYTKAEAHYVSILLPKCLTRFQMFAQMERDKRHMQQQSQQFRRECLLGFCLARWCHSYHTSLDVCMMERMAIMHYDHNVAQRLFIEWKQRTRLQLQEQTKEDMAMDHYEVHLMRDAVHTWKAYILGSMKRKEHQYKAARHNYLNMLKKSWISWTKFVAHQKVKTNKLIKADTYYRHQLLQRTLGAWKAYQQGMCTVYESVEERQQRHHVATLRWTFALWVENVRLQREETRNAAIADHHHNICRLKKVMTSWRQYAILHGHKERQKADRLHQIKVQLDKGKCRRALQAWKSFKDEALLQHLAERRAIVHFRRRHLHKTLDQWKRYRQLQIKKTLLQRQCAWLHNTRISAKYFLRWRAQHHAALAEHSKTTIALWQWSLVLQQKVLNVWLQYVVQQRRKKQRIALAMEARRQRLLKEGVGQWLRVAMDMAERREKRAAQQHAQIAYRSYHTVRRCANHWRQKTLANRHKRSERGLLSQPVHHHQSKSPTQSVDLKSVRCVQQQPRPMQASSAAMRPDTGVMQSLDRRPPGLPKASTRVPSVAHSATHSLKEHFDNVGSVIGNGTRSSRPKPRRPDFLMESLQKEGLWKSASFHIQSDSELHPSHLVEDTRQRCQSSDSSDNEEDTLQESLPRRTPPPPPSPQPKHLAEPSRTVITSRTDRTPDVDNVPSFLTSFGSDNTLDSNWENDGRNMEDRGAIPGAPLLMPPSAFTTMKAASDNTRHPPDRLLQNQPIGSSVTNPDSGHDDEQHRHHQPSQTDTLAAIQRTSSATNLEFPSRTPQGMLADKENVSPRDVPNSEVSRPPDLLSPDAFTVKDSHKKATDGTSLSERLDGDQEDGVDGSHHQDKVYKEIVELKNQLVQYQQAKERLRSLKEQYRHLKSWLRELEDLQGERDSNVLMDDDEDTRDVREEVTQMESEIAELMSELDRRKPECAQIPAKVNALALQIQ